MATQTETGLPVSVLPDSGSTLNIASKASCLRWGLQIQELAPGEANLSDVLGKTTISLSLPARGLHTTLSLVVSDTLGLQDLIVGWRDLQKWGVLQLQDEEVSGEGEQGVFAITPAARQFLRDQSVFPPQRTFKEIDPADPQYIHKMESACAVVRKQLLEDVPLAFSDTLEPCNVVDTPPVRIHIRDGMTPRSLRLVPSSILCP